MIARIFLNFEGAVDLLNEDETSHLVGEGEGGETNPMFRLAKEGRGDPLGPSDDKVEGCSLLF